MSITINRKKEGEEEVLTLQNIFLIQKTHSNFTLHKAKIIKAADKKVAHKKMNLRLKK